MMVKSDLDFALREIEPIVAEIEEQDELPEDILQKYAKARMLGMMVPKEYGGIGSTALNMILIIEELAKTGSAAVVLPAKNFNPPKNSTQMAINRRRIFNIRIVS